MFTHYIKKQVKPGITLTYVAHTDPYPCQAEIERASNERWAEITGLVDIEAIAALWGEGFRGYTEVDSVDVWIDDGTITLLADKPDGQDEEGCFYNAKCNDIAEYEVFDIGNND